jgi:hypothetical protein
MDDARFALTQARCFYLREEIGRGIDDRHPKVRGFAKLEEWFPDDLPASPMKYCAERMLKQQQVHFGQKRFGGKSATFDSQDGGS